MNLRVFIFLVLCAIHAALLFLGAGPIAPLVAGSVYLPLMGLGAAGFPVFSGAEPGGWSSPGVLGWCVVAALWATIWWLVAGSVIKFRRKNRSDA